MGKSRKNTDFGFMVTREMAGEWVENIKKTDPEGWKDAASGLEGHDDVTWILQEYISESGADYVAEIEDEDDFVRFDEILLPNPDGTYDKSDVKPLYIITSDTDRNYFGEENNKEAVESVKNTMRTLHAPESFEPLYEKNTGYVEESVAELIPEDDEEPSVSAKDIRELFKRTLDSMKEYPTIFLNDGAHKRSYSVVNAHTARTIITVQHMFSNVRTRITGGTQKKAPSSILRTGSVRTEKRRKKKQTINSPR